MKSAFISNIVSYPRGDAVYVVTESRCLGSGAPDLAVAEG